VPFQTTFSSLSDPHIFIKISNWSHKITECSINAQNCHNYCTLCVMLFCLFLLLIPFPFPTNCSCTCSH
jgi:hypothetical protein